MQELGVDYRLDSTHYIEYRQEEFFSELDRADLRVLEYELKWGEIWSYAVLKNRQ